MKRIILLVTLSIAFGLNLQAQKGLPVGFTAPAINGTDQNGKKISLKQLLQEHQSVVVFFYRGQWCPYCNKQIKELQDSLQLLSRKKTYLLGITPENSENISKTIKKTGASFSIIQDADDAIMKAYGVNFTMDDATVTKYKGYGINLESNNGNPRHTLPIPATYIINRSGKIKYVHFDPNYQKRASIKTLLAEL